MRRLAITLTLALVVVALGALPAPAHDSTTILAGCTGYQTTKSVTTAAGNVYTSKRNLCLGLYSISPDGQAYTVEAVERAKCYRNGVLYGSGTGGCRWDGYIDSQFWVTGIGWVQRNQTYWCDTCGGSFIADSGRHYGGHVAYNWGDKLREVGNNRRVTFYFADGTTGTYGESATIATATCCNW